MRGAELLALCKEALARSGVAEAEVFARWAARGCARFSIGDLSQHMELVEQTAVVRVAVGARVAEAQTSVLEVSAVEAAIASASKAATVVPETPHFPGFSSGDGSIIAVPRFADATAAATAEERVALLGPAMERVRKAGLVSAGMLETTVTSCAVATTRGAARSFDGTLASFKVWALETPGAGGAAGYGGHMHRDVRSLEIEREAERAVRICEMGRNPGSLDEGSYDVVMEPAAVAELVEWLGSTAFGASEVEQGTSPMRIGERVTGDAIDIVEDPFDAEGTGFGAPFDREGTAKQKVTLIERGVAKAILFDRAAASRMGEKSTGSAFASSEGSGIAAGALHMGGGQAASVEELISGVDRGLYVCRLHYVNGLLDTQKSVMTGLTRDGCFLVENGKIVRGLGNLRFTDSFLGGLSRADGMTKARAAIPTWWSDAGAIVVPAVRMRAFRFNGKSQEPPRLE